MAEFKPFDLGAARGAGMRNALGVQQFQQNALGLDPNSQANQLRALQLQNARQQAEDASFQYGDHVPIPGTSSVAQRGPRGKYHNVITPKSSDTSLITNWKEAQKGGYKGSLADWAKLKNPGTNIEINSAGLKKEQQILAENRADRYNEMLQSSYDAEGRVANLRALSNIDLDTGFGEEYKSEAARILKGFGVQGAERLLDANIAGVQAFNALSGKMVLDVMASQKGPQTKEDQLKIAETLPSIGNEKLANKFIMNSLEAMDSRQIERAQFYNDYLSKHDTLGKNKNTGGEGADREWNRYMRRNPMVSQSVKNPETGLPMFYYQFREKAKKANPQATMEQINQAWYSLNE